jgi:hypothetical protein
MINIPHIYGTERRGERARYQRDRERERVCARGRVVTRRGGISRKNDRWRDGPFGIKIEGLF